jgi:dipeptidyl aminopeptidase/acylaminoacyl peptidase
MKRLLYLSFSIIGILIIISGCRAQPSETPSSAISEPVLSPNTTSAFTTATASPTVPTITTVNLPLITGLPSSSPSHIPTLTSSSPIPRPPPSQTSDTMKGKMVFTSWQDGNPEIYSINEDGTDLTRLTNNTVQDISPKISHDGKKIAFVSARDGNKEIYVMNVDGSNQTRLTDNNVNDEFPDISFDGKKIVYRSSNQIWVMDIDGGNPQQIKEAPAGCLNPVWSPDGTKMVFSMSLFYLMIMNTDGSNQVKLGNLFTASDPDWNPDGRTIAFSGDGVRTMPIDAFPTSENSALIKNYKCMYLDEALHFPAWSPDGSKLAFIVFAKNKWEIYYAKSTAINKTHECIPRTKVFESTATIVDLSWGGS